jgi:hypothetical protein
LSNMPVAREQSLFRSGQIMQIDTAAYKDTERWLQIKADSSGCLHCVNNTRTSFAHYTVGG